MIANGAVHFTNSIEFDYNFAAQKLLIDLLISRPFFGLHCPAPPAPTPTDIGVGRRRGIVSCKVEAVVGENFVNDPKVLQFESNVGMGRLRTPVD